VKVPLTQAQFDALVSFAFWAGYGNFRNSNVLSDLNSGNYDKVPEDLNQWIKSSGVEYPGLVTRRQDEGNLFQSEGMPSGYAAPAGASIGFPVTLTLYVHNGDANGPIIPGAQVTGQDGSGNGFQVITGDLGYVTITENPGTWSITASAPGFQNKSWNQIITDNSTRHAFLQAVQQPESVASAAPGSKSSVVGKWAEHGEGFECKSITGGHEYVSEVKVIPGGDSVIDFHYDGTFTIDRVTAGEWVQYGDTISLQFNPKPMSEHKVSEDFVNEQWYDGPTIEATINGDTMSGTGSSSSHSKSYFKQHPEQTYYADHSCSYRWSASRV